jgi:hypothetical protein
VGTGAENLAYTGIRSPDRQARSESLYLKRYSGPYNCVCVFVSEIEKFGNDSCRYLIYRYIKFRQESLLYFSSSDMRDNE